MSAISTWSTTPANNNNSAPNGAPEGMAPSGVNDTIRELMARIREWYEDAQWIDLGLTPTRLTLSTFTIAGNYVSIYSVGRRVKMAGSSTAYGTISASSYAAPDTTITIAEGNIPSTLSTASLSILTPDNSAVPTRFPAGPTDFTGGGLRVTSDTAHSSGAGLELAYDAANTRATVQAYDRTASAARELRLNGSTVSVRVNGTQVALATAPTSGIAWAVSGAIQVAGAATLGATSSPGIWSYEYPTVRYYLGDNTGYDLRFSHRTGSTTTDVFRFTEAGALTASSGAAAGPIVALIDTAASANNGRWRLRNVGEQFRIEAYNDADDASGNAITIERTGTTIDSVAVSTKLELASHTTSTSASAGGASALPATPTGYVTVAVNGVDKKIPYYD